MTEHLLIADIHKLLIEAKLRQEEEELMRRMEREEKGVAESLLERKKEISKAMAEFCSVPSKEVLDFANEQFQGGLEDVFNELKTLEKEMSTEEAFEKIKRRVLKRAKEGKTSRDYANLIPEWTSLMLLKQRHEQEKEVFQF